MRRFLIGASTLALALALGTTSASAQFFVAGGMTMPSGDFGDAYKAGWVANAGAAIVKSGDERAKVWIEGIFGQNNFDGEADAKSTMIGGFGSATYDLSMGGSAVPYVIGSVGYISQKLESGNASQTEGGLAFGGGAGVGFGKFYVEGRYFTASIADATTAFLMLAAGVTF
jgi:hypothetical protein